MHEYSVAEDMMGLIEKTLGERRQLLAVTMTIGVLSGVSPESLRFCFSEIARQSGFGEPELRVDSAPALIRCRSCSREYETDDLRRGCPSCSSPDMVILSGRQCTVDSVEIETDGGG